GVVVAACGINEDFGVEAPSAVAVGQETIYGEAGYFCDGVPNRHIQHADGDGTLAMASRLFVAHDRGPDTMGIEVFARFIEERFCGSRFKAREKAIAQEPAGRVASIRIEAVTNDRLAFAHGVGDERENAHSHLAEVDVCVTNLRLDGDNRFTDIDDAHGICPQYSGIAKRASANCVAIEAEALEYRSRLRDERLFRSGWSTLPRRERA